MMSSIRYTEKDSYLERCVFKNDTNKKEKNRTKKSKHEFTC